MGEKGKGGLARPGGGRWLRLWMSPDIKGVSTARNRRGRANAPPQIELPLCGGFLPCDCGTAGLCFCIERQYEITPTQTLSHQPDMG